ncbi:MAG TPA: hypothetical protein VKH35_01995 [Thermoanaerobaculia bacterium]|nr:hypothetical protein [Thermoanaerobaculia bacterium]
MARRIMAAVAMVILLGLLLILVWQVYLHHCRSAPADEPAVVERAVRPLSATST